MLIDARPFFTLTTLSGQSCQCLRPRVASNKGPFSGSPNTNRPINEDETHSVTAFAPLPTDLMENGVVIIDKVRYRVRKGGITITPSGARLSLAREVVTKGQRSPFSHE